MQLVLEFNWQVTEASVLILRWGWPEQTKAWIPDAWPTETDEQRKKDHASKWVNSTMSWLLIKKLRGQSKMLQGNQTSNMQELEWKLCLK